MKKNFQLLPIPIAIGMILLFCVFSCRKMVNRQYLQAAVQAESWIDSNRIETRKGFLWPSRMSASVEQDSLFMYHGLTGVILFYLELHHTTEDPGYLKKATLGADYLLHRIPDSLRNETTSGLYMGWGGTAYALHKVYESTKNKKYFEGAIKCMDLIKRKARATGSGVEWSGVSDIVYGSSGTGLVLLYAAKHMSQADALPLAIAAGNQLVETAVPAEKGLKWKMSPGDTFYMPNFSYGTSGICYFLARLYEETGKKEFLTAALKGAEYLESIEEKNGLIFHHEPGGKDVYFMGVCHGPAGTSRLFYELYRVTKDKKWLEKIAHVSETVMRSGIPEKLQPGFWNNVGQCCGSAGLAEYYQDLYRIFKNEKYKGFAEKLTENLLSRARVDSTSAMRWIHAENRKDPAQLFAQTGYMQGAAGIGIWLLHLDGYENGIEPFIKLPDQPF